MKSLISEISAVSVATRKTCVILNEPYCVPPIAAFPKLLLPANVSKVRLSAWLPPTLRED